MMFQQFKKGVIQGIWIISVVIITGITYAAFTIIPQAVDGEPLTATKWNALVDRLNSIDQKQLATAWVNFDGTNCPGNICTIRSSYNISNVTRLATGKYQINFLTTMDDNLYSIVASNSLGLWASSVQIWINFLTHSILDNNYSNVPTQYDTTMNVQVFGWKN